MFGFFKKRREQKAALHAEQQARINLMREAEAGRASPLDLALAIHEQEGSKESFARLLMILPRAEFYTLNSTTNRLEDMAVSQLGEDPFLVLFTSVQHAQSAAETPFDNIQKISALELLFKAKTQIGWVINPGTPVVCGILTAPMLETAIHICSDLRLPEGALYTLWDSGCYRLVRILKTDATGVHYQLYPGGWHERPVAPDPSALKSDLSESRGIGHLPITRRSFLASGPIPVSDTNIPVTEEHLEGYRIWEEAQGGYFGQL